MWTRRELKGQAQEALQRNYWKSVLVALILTAVGGNWMGSLFSSMPGNASTVVVDESVVDERYAMISDMGEEQYGGHSMSIITEEEGDYSEVTADIIIPDMDKRNFIITGVLVFAIFIIVFMFVIVFLLFFEILLGFPVIVGAGRFMLKSLDGRAEIKEVAYAFDHSYRNVVKTMFCTQLSVFLWSLLFIIPGIYKQYQYRMVEYIMAEHPDMHYKDAMQLSKDMMDGEKWHAFVLDLSFVLWVAASIMTCGILYVMFVAPYQYLTNAALYRKLCMEREARNREYATEDM